MNAAELGHKLGLMTKQALSITLTNPYGWGALAADRTLALGLRSPGYKKQSPETPYREIKQKLPIGSGMSARFGNFLANRYDRGYTDVPPAEQLARQQRLTGAGRWSFIHGGRTVPGAGVVTNRGEVFR